MHEFSEFRTKCRFWRRRFPALSIHVAFAAPTFNRPVQDRVAAGRQEMYYVTPDWEVMAVKVTTTPTFQGGRPDFFSSYRAYCTEIRNIGLLLACC